MLMNKSKPAKPPVRDMDTEDHDLLKCMQGKAREHAFERGCGMVRGRAGVRENDRKARALQH